MLCRAVIRRLSAERHQDPLLLLVARAVSLQNDVVDGRLARGRGLRLISPPFIASALYSDSSCSVNLDDDQY